MTSRFLFAIATLAGACAAAAAAADTPARIVRTPLLTAVLDGRPAVQRVEVKRIELAAGQPSGRHTHPCPVVSYVVSGTVLFQIEGQAPQRIGAGGAILEPADAVVTHFDAVDGPATFVASYLLREDQHEIIRMLE